MVDLETDADGNEVVPFEDQLELLPIRWEPRLKRWVNYELGEHLE